MLGIGASALAQSGVPSDSVGRLNHAGYRNKQHCTASLLPGGLAVTAAHCVEGLDAGGLHFLLGYDRGRWSAKPDVKGYVSSQRGRDLALLCLAGRPPGGLPLAAQGPEDHERLFVLGYGVPRVHVQQRLDCFVDARRPGIVFRLSCPLAPGTSGGPVLRERQDGGVELVGVVSATGPTTSLAYEVTQATILPLCP